MKTSLNELENLIYKAAEGLGLPDGICTSMAESVVFSESLGLNALSDCLNFFSKFSPPDTCPELIQTGKHVYELNKVEEETIYFAEICACLVVEKFLREPNAEILFTGESKALFLLPHFKNLISKPVELHCPNLAPEETWVFRIRPDSPFPEMLKFRGNGKKIRIKQTERSLEEIQESLPGNLEKKTSEDFARIFEQNLTLGCEVSDKAFGDLMDLAKKVLVENSPVSRKNAGESTDFLDVEDVLPSS